MDSAWRRRAKIYRDAMGRDAEAYRCLKEAHACAPNDPEVAYQLRTAAMIRGEHSLAASLLYREIAGAPSSRDRGALHFELALIYEERLSDPQQAQVNYEQALACDPSIPAAKTPLARRYHSTGRYADAARLYDEAAAIARPGDRPMLLEAAARCRNYAADAAPTRPTPVPTAPLADGTGAPTRPTPVPIPTPAAADKSPVLTTPVPAQLVMTAADPSPTMRITPRSIPAQSDVALTITPSTRSSSAQIAAQTGHKPRAATEPPGPPGDPAEFVASLDKAEEAGDRDAAVRIAHELWRAAPGHIRAFRVLAALHRAASDLDELTSLATAVSARRDGATAEERAGAWLEVARLAEELDDREDAARAYDHALAEQPTNVSALDARGNIAYADEDFATADLIYRDLNPGDSMLGDDEVALRRSVIAEHLGRLPDALEQAQVSAATAPGRLDVLARVQDLATRTGDLDVALDAARGVLDLVPLDDDDGQLEMSFRLVDLLRQAGDLNGAAAQLERVIRDQPHHVGALEALADIYIERNDWTTATRYLYQLVPLAPSPAERADCLFRLGEAVLVHLGDVDRADDVFLRASDLDPSHVPTLRRLLDVYWRADDPAALVEVAGELASAGALGPEIGTDDVAAAGSSRRGDEPPVPRSALAHALVAAALQGDSRLASSLGIALGAAAPSAIAAALAELAERDGRLTLGSASSAVAELGRKGMVDLVALKAAAEGTEVASALV